MYYQLMHIKIIKKCLEFIAFAPKNPLFRMQSLILDMHLMNLNLKMYFFYNNQSI